MEPFVSCCFMSDNKIFINLLYYYDKTHYHFFYDYEKREVCGQVVKMDLKNGQSNFPFRCFYNDEDDEVYSFYRQGEAFIISGKDSSDY